MGNLGQKIRDARVAKDLTLREMARRTGLTPSQISQIELGRSNPSVASLYSIANALGLSMDYFFGTEPQPANAAQPASNPPHGGSDGVPVVHAEDRDVVQIAGGVEWQRLTPRNDQSIEFIHIRYDVGASTGDRAYRHGGREYGVVLQGHLSVELGFNKHVLGPGDSISFDSSIPHRLANAGDEPMVGIWVIVDRH